MNFDNLPAGENVSYDIINMVIQIPSHGSPVQYRVDKDSGTLTMDSFMVTAMFSCNYGFMPHTQSVDGDALNSDKWVNVEGWAGGEQAEQGILGSIHRYNSL